MSCSKEMQLNAQGIQVFLGNQTFTATLYNNSTATAFKAMLPLTLTMSELNNNEKYAALPSNLPTAATHMGTIQNGDIMLYGGSTLVLFYKSFSTSDRYTKIGRVDNPIGLQAALGSGTATVTFQATTTNIETVGADNSHYRIANLTKEAIVVEGDFTKLTLVEMNGGVVASSTHSPLRVANLQSGCYILQIEDGKKAHHHKIFKQ